MPVPGEDSRLVYSTDGERVLGRPSRSAPRPRGGRTETATQPAPPSDGVVRVQRTKRGRGGKTVTLVTGLPGGEAELDRLLKELKQHCGAGGARDGSAIEIQGDHRERLRARLEALGYRVRLAGG